MHRATIMDEVATMKRRGIASLANLLASQRGDAIRDTDPLSGFMLIIEAVKLRLRRGNRHRTVRSKPCVHALLV